MPQDSQGPGRQAIPLLFVGDSPHLPTGLGRILRDVSTRVTAEALQLGVLVTGALLATVLTGLTAWFGADVVRVLIR